MIDKRFVVVFLMTVVDREEFGKCRRGLVGKKGRSEMWAGGSLKSVCALAVGVSRRVVGVVDCRRSGEAIQTDTKCVAGCWIWGSETKM